jgi:hypothetical protein
LGDTRAEDMKTLEHIETMEGYSCFRLSGNGPLEEAANKVIEAITFAREQGIRNLLIDVTHWTGHPNPTTMERFNWAEAFARAALAKVKVAMVVPAEFMDPEKFEVTVGRNRGLFGNVFDSEKDALEWLLDPKGA